VMASDSQILALSTMFTEDVFTFYGGTERFGEAVQVQMGRAFVIVVFGVVISQIAGLLLQGPFLIAMIAAGPDTALGYGAAIVGALAASLASAVAQPLTTVALVVLYFDARARHEGYDLELMIDAIDPAGPASVIAVAE